MTGSSFTPNRPPEQPPPPSLGAGLLRPGGQVGPYEVLEKISEGGFAVVYLAKQQRPIRRRVALKVLKQGKDSREILARFEAERQALALMDHVHIAKIFDAGTTEDGRSYFVMEHIDGAPITDYCDEHQLNNRQRLRLFQEVCEAVQHAHFKAVIHRDLKPSNILVQTVGGKAVPKVIDFGIAKAVDQKLSEQTLHTQLGALVGTPAYMSPEQIDMEDTLKGGIDTRVDVYALGVILYELLVGQLPFEVSKRGLAGMMELLQAISDDEPPRPSTRITPRSDESTDWAQRRAGESRTLWRELSGDLDWIALRALAKDRERRYDSPKDLAEDIERFLHDQPVRARPPSALYRARKFVRRNLLAVGAACAAVLVLAVFAATMAVQNRRIATERDLAEQARAEVERTAERARQVEDYVVGWFKNTDPFEGGRDLQQITGKELLDLGLQNLDAQLGEQPLARAKILDTIGEIYWRSALYDEAEPLFEKGLRIRESILGPDHPDVATSLDHLALLLEDTNHPNEAEPLYRRALAIQESSLGPDHPDVAHSLNYLAHLLWSTNRFAEAEPLYRRALAIQESSLRPDHPDITSSLNNLGGLLWSTDRPAEAEPLFRRALGLLEQSVGPNHPDVATNLNNLGSLLQKANRPAEAEPLFRRALEIRESSLGPNHPSVATSLNNLGFLLNATDRPSEAEPLYRRALGIRESSLGPDHPRVANSLNNLGELLRATDRPAEAESLYRRALEIWESSLGLDSPEAAITSCDLARLLVSIQEIAEAKPMIERCAPTLLERFGPDHRLGQKAQTTLDELEAALRDTR